MKLDQIIDEVDVLVQRVAALVAGRDGRLVALTVTTPPERAHLPLDSLLVERLANVGLDFIDIVVKAEPGPMRLVSAEFER